MKRNMKEWSNFIVNSEKKFGFPIMTHPGIDAIGKKVIDAVTDGKVQFNAIMALNKLYPSIASASMMDLTVEAEAFGCKINFSENSVPTVASILANTKETIEKLSVPKVTAGRVPQYLNAVKLTAENIKEKPVFGGCIGPFSLAGRLYDMTEIMTALFTDTEVVEVLLEKCNSFIWEYIKEIKKSGANGVLIAEPAAGLLSPEMCQQFSTDYIKRIIDDIQDESFAVILHNCGNSGHVTQQMINSGAFSLHLGNAIDMVHALKEIPSDVIVFGNLDPVNIFKNGTPEKVRTSTLDLLHATKTFKNFVISSGCDVPPHTPLANINAFYEAIAEFNLVLNGIC